MSIKKWTYRVPERLILRNLIQCQVLPEDDHLIARIAVAQLVVSSRHDPKHASPIQAWMKLPRF